ncbi:MAG: NADPH:quinone oxidoreductase family protein [Myxococcota bacterium]|nr:NADPH:quinone oxidoreductase family protein [Myxococcota bacterium]
MKAWRVAEHGEPEKVLVLEDHVALPEPAPDQVRIRVGAAALNFGDDLLCRGTYQLRPGLPFTPGLEVAGEVVAAGAEAGLAEGTRVMGVPALPAGGLAEYALADARNCYPIPSSLPDLDAAAMLIPFQTGHVALHRRGGLKAGETLLVHAGAGGVGSAAIQLGKVAGARVIATAGGPEKVAICRELGADLAIDYLEEDFAPAVREATGGKGADVIYDPVGGKVFEASRKCVAWEGRILVVGFAGGEMLDAPMNQLLFRSYSLVGVYMGEYSHRDRPFLDAVHQEILDLSGAGRIKPLIHARVSMEEVSGAIASLAGRATAGKVVVEVA